MSLANSVGILSTTIADTFALWASSTLLHYPKSCPYCWQQSALLNWSSGPRLYWSTLPRLLQILCARNIETLLLSLLSVHRLLTEVAFWREPREKKCLESSLETPTLHRLYRGIPPSCRPSTSHNCTSAPPPLIDSNSKPKWKAKKTS